jgi:hypothetical protein
MHILKLKMHIPKLKMHIPKLKMHILKLKMHILKLKMHIPKLNVHILMSRRRLAGGAAYPLSPRYAHLASMANGPWQMAFPPQRGGHCLYSPRYAHLASMANGPWQMGRLGVSRFGGGRKLML